MIHARCPYRRARLGQPQALDRDTKDAVAGFGHDNGGATVSVPRITRSQTPVDGSRSDTTREGHRPDAGGAQWCHPLTVDYAGRVWLTEED